MHVYSMSVRCLSVWGKFFFCLFAVGVTFFLLSACLLSVCQLSLLFVCYLPASWQLPHEIVLIQYSESWNLWVVIPVTTILADYLCNMCCLSTFCRLPVCCLSIICCLSVCYLGVCCILSTVCILSVHCLFAIWSLLAICRLAVCELLFVCLVSISYVSMVCLHSVYTLFCVCRISVYKLFQLYISCLDANCLLSVYLVQHSTITSSWPFNKPRI